MSTAKPKAAKAPAKKTAAPKKALAASIAVAVPAPAPKGPVLVPAPAPAPAAARKPGTPPAGSKARAPVRPSPVLAAAQAASKPVVPVKAAAAKAAAAPAAAKADASAARALTGKGAPAAQAPAAAADAKLVKNLANQPPRALNSPIRIFQIYFEPWQRELLDPAFYPLDNSRGTSELLEFNVFEQLQKNAATQGSTLWGALSWRFGEKTGMHGQEWVKQIVDHPGHDVYNCNPHPLNEALFHNMWLQGETAHPRFLEVVAAFLKAAGLEDQERISVQPSSAFSAANYFVGSPAFWSRYIQFIKKALVAADRHMPPDLRDLMHSRMADDRNLHAGATYVPFIVERLFAVFMRTDGKDLKPFKIALPERERELNVHLKLLREMKDVAHRTKSAWLAACWVNYRNLYFSQTSGKAWCDKHLKAVTPTEVQFSS